MASASIRLRRLGLLFSTATVGYLVSPLAQIVPWATGAAAEDGGLGAGGAGLAYNFVLAVSIILAFIFGFAIRDFIHRRAMRAKSAKKPTAAPKRA